MIARSASHQPVSAPLRPGRFMGLDGREYAAVNVATHSAFARACLIEWTRLDGVDRSYLLKVAKSISVPVVVLAPARAQLRPSEVPPEASDD